MQQEEIDKILHNLHKYPKANQAKILEIVKTLADRKTAHKRRTSLLDFIMYMEPTYKIGAHHRKLAGLLEDMAFGRKDRVSVNIGPRFGKSMMTSILFPAWFIGNFPKKKIMLVSHTADLAVDFGRKVRNIVDSTLYRDVFPDVALAVDSKSAGRWSTNHGGDFFACGVGGALSGRGADFLCLAGWVQVETKDGIVKLKDVKIGQEIKTPYGWEKITNKWLTIHNECVKVNSIEASVTHPFLTKRGWVNSGELLLNDKILTQTIWRTLWNKIKIPFRATNKESLARYDEQVLYNN